MKFAEFTGRVGNAEYAQQGIEAIKNDWLFNRNALLYLQKLLRYSMK